MCIRDRYNSVTTEQVEAMKRLIGHADVMTPNLTEACLLADVPCEHADWQKLMDRLSENGASVLITSAGDAVVGVDARTGMQMCIRDSLKRGQKLVDGFVLAFADVLRDAGLDVVGQQHL